MFEQDNTPDELWLAKRQACQFQFLDLAERTWNNCCTQSLFYLKKTTIVALARKLLVALWKYLNAGVVIEGAVMKTA